MMHDQRIVKQSREYCGNCGKYI